MNASPEAIRECIARVDGCIRGNVEYEHGTDRKTPRANVFRPYRLTLDGVMAAVLVMRASEAFRLCEVDVFLTTELPGLPDGETTRAALTFLLADATRNGGSMAIQFVEPCGKGGVPDHVRAIATELGVSLGHAERGAISPTEARALYLRLSGLDEAATRRVSALSDLGHFSPERVAWLVSSGTWPAREAELILLACPHPSILLGDSAFAESRHLYALALGHGRAAVLAGHFDRYLSYLEPSGAPELDPRPQYVRIPARAVAGVYGVLHGPLPAPRDHAAWAVHPGAAHHSQAGECLLVLPRPRGREEIRLFLRQDLDAARAAAAEGIRSVLLYPSELLELPEDERMEACAAAERRGVWILACPENLATLDADVERRLAAGRRLRR